MEVGAVLIGAAVGADFDLMPFLISRYFGLRNLGRLYGLVLAIFTVGTAAGSAFMGFIFDRAHSYQPAFITFEILLAIGALALLLMGPYKYPVEERRSASSEPSAVKA